MKGESLKHDYKVHRSHVKLKLLGEEIIKVQVMVLEKLPVL